MESGENPEQSRCGIRIRIPIKANRCKTVKAGTRHESGSPNTSSASLVLAPFSEMRRAKGLSAKKGDRDQRRFSDARVFSPLGHKTTTKRTMKKSTRSITLAILGATIAFACPASFAATVTFETVSLGGSAGPAGVWKGDNGAADLTLEGATFHNNNFTDPYSYWSGFAFSNHTDTTTAGYGNEFSAYPGSGADGSATYAIGYYSSYDLTSTQIDLGVPTNLAGLGVSVANTTLTALALQNGLFGARAFVAGDWLTLTITGYNGLSETGSIDIYLADFRNGNSDILSDWAFVDLTDLQTADRITFTMDSSDSGAFGVNTPTYFALDNFLAVPEPSALLLGFASLTIFARRKRVN